MTSARAVAILAVIVGLSAGCSKDPEAAKREYLASGDRYTAEGKDAEAIIQYQNALQQDPRFGQARVKLADAHARLGNYAGAAREYIRAADLLPGDTELQLTAARYLLLTRQYQDAKSRAAKVLVVDPRNAQAHVIIGSALAGLKDLPAALNELEEANKLEPTAAAHANLGAVRLAQGERNLAEAEFKKALELEPRNVNVYLALTNFHLANGDSRQAEVTLRKGLEIEPTNPLANRALAAIYLSGRRLAEAEPVLKALAASDVNPEGANRLAWADFLLTTGRLPEAIKVLEPLSTVKASSGQSRPRLAVILYQQGKAVEAHKLVDEVLASEPRNVLALLTKARFCLIEQRLDESLDRARQAAVADPRSVPAHYLVGNVLLLKKQYEEAAEAYRQVLKINPRAGAAQLQLSRLSLMRGEADAALRLARDADKASPGALGPQLLIAKSLIAQREYARADAVIRALLASNPSVAAVHATAGTVAILRQDRTAARRSYERALALDPAELEALNGLSALDVAEGKASSAEARVVALLAKYPDRAEMVALGATTYEKLGKFDRAEALLKALIERDPTSLAAYAQLAHLYLVQQKLNQARSEFDQIAQRNPRSVGARTMAAMILDSQGSTVEARRRYEEILKIDPRAAVASNNLAYIYAETGGNLEVALELAQNAVAQVPQANEFRDTLGFVHLKRGLPQLAIEHFEKSVKGDPTNPVYSYHLGLALAGTGDKARARQALDRALSLSQSFPGAGDARKVLGTL